MYRYKKYWSRKASNKSGRVHGGKRKDPVYEKMPGHIGHSRNRPDPPLLFKKITVRRPLWKRKARPRKVRRERPPHRAGLRIPRILWRTPPLPHWIPPLPQNRPQRRTLPPKNTTTDPITSPTASATETPTEPSAAPPPVMEPEPKMNVLVIGDSNTEYGHITGQLEEILEGNSGQYANGYRPLSANFLCGFRNGVYIKNDGKWTRHDMTDSNPPATASPAAYGSAPKPPEPPPQSGSKGRARISFT